VRRFCFFHAGCPDGFGAVWSVRLAWGEDARYVPRGHDDPLDASRHDGDVVAFVDIAPPNEALIELADLAAKVVVLDHHVSARDRYHSHPEAENLVDAGGHIVHFDLEHSGAILAWNHFHPGEPPPDLLRYVEDQDLWNWKLPRSDEVNAAIGSYPLDFEIWNQLAARPIDELAAEGTSIVRSNRMEVERAVNGAHTITIGNDRAEAVNARFQRAPIGHELAKRAAYGKPWGLVYRIQGTRVDATLYSIGDLDISKIAERYGGGGHRNASGFSIDLDRWRNDFVLD
jgi:hypothetical protein